MCNPVCDRYTHFVSQNADQALRDTFEDVVQSVNAFLAPMNAEGDIQKGLLIIDGNLSTEAKYHTLISGVQEIRNTIWLPGMAT